MPLDLSSFPDEPTIVKPEKDKALAKTISDIEAGKPAPKTHWQGKDLPGYNQPSSSQSKLDISGFPTDKKEPVKPEPKKEVSFGKQLAKETAGAVGGLADIVSGLGTSLAGTATAATVGAVTGSSVKGREYAGKITSLMPTNMAPQVRDTIAYHAMMYPFEKISQGIDYLSGKVEEKHGKEAGAAAKTSLEIASLAIPIPGLKAAKGIATEALTKPSATDVANLRAKFDAQNKSYNAMEALKKVQAEKVAEIRDPSTGTVMRNKEDVTKQSANFPQKPVEVKPSTGAEIKGKLGEPIEKPVTVGSTRPRRGVGAKQGGAVDPEVFVEGLRKAGLSFKEFSDRIAQEFGEGARAMAVDLYQGQTSPEKQRGVVKQTLADIGRWTKLEPAHKMPTDELIRTRNGEINAYNRVLRNQKDRWEQLVPSEEARNEISRAIETKTVETLTPEQQTVAREYMAFRDQIGKEGMDVGVLKGVLDDYVTHIVEEANDKSVAQRIVEDVFNTVQARDAVGGSPKSGFGKERKYKVTMDELNEILREKGLRVKTQDIGQIAEQYGKSMRRAIENKKLIESLKETPAFDSSRPYLFKPTDEYPAPRDWKYLNHPQTQGMAVHPELYDSLKTVLSSNDPNVIERGLYNLSMGTKRLNVIGSMFHAKSLGEVYINAMGRDIKFTTYKGLPVPDVSEAVRKFREGGLGDELDLGMKQGLKLEIPHDVDVKILQEAGKFADKMFPKAGAPFRVLDAINSKIDKATWEYMHTGLKSALFLREFERMGNENPGMPKEQVAREVATYVNDLAGGLDWFGIAADAKTQLGREIGMAFASPRGQMLAQILMFAPDWTISTLRAGWNGVSSLPTSIARFEALSPKTKEGLYQRYAMRSALLWLTVLNGLNMMTAGKPIWDNQDPTRIELKDGTTMQAGKHTFEFVHAMTDPVKFAYNKLGIAPRTMVDTFAEMKGAEPFPGQADKSLPRRLAESALPFSVQPFLDPSMTSNEALTRAVAGFAGVPIYGFTPEQKAEQRAARRLRKRQKMQEWKLKQAN